MERMSGMVFSARIGACAAILRDEKRAKVAQIAESRGVSEDDAARMYVVGALKNAIRCGASRNYADALDRFEADQIGDRQVSVHGEDATAREVRRINRSNGRGYTRIMRDGRREDIDVPNAKPVASHKRNMGKVLGTIYVEWEASEASAAPEIILELAERDAVLLHAEDAIASYIDEYVTRLSSTAKASIRKLVHNAYSVEDIMSGKTDETAKLRERIKYLHHNFPHAEAITAREMLGMLRKYAA